ncbi:MAG: phosphatase PAP2 family protein [Acidimicrobiia bacterium]
MAEASTTTPDLAATGRGPRTKRIRHGWLIEVGVGIAIYFLYDTLRERAMGTTTSALRNAKQVVDVERLFGLYQEHRIQHAFLDWSPFISFWNIYYGTIHFVMPVIALVAMYRKAPARYVRWRNALLFMLAFGLIGFFAYPLTPPRLMPAHYNFVDTAAEFFNFGPQQRIVLTASGQPTAASRAAFGNLYAAMPRLHVGWSTWSALALLPLIRRRWLKVLVCLYPLATIFAIVVTGNHWILDAVGGWVVLAAGYGAARLLELVTAGGRRAHP